MNDTVGAFVPEHYCLYESPPCVPFPYMKITMLLINSFLLFEVLKSTATHLRSKSDKRSWSWLFLTTTAAWAALREAFFLCTLLKTTNWTEKLFLFLYWLPDPIQFCSFMVVPLFYAEIFHIRTMPFSRGRPPRWSPRWSPPREVSSLLFKYLLRPLYIATIFSMCGFMSTWIIISSLNSKDVKIPNEIPYSNITFPMPPSSFVLGYETADYGSDGFRLLTAVCFTTLSFVLCAYGAAINSKSSKNMQRKSRDAQRKSTIKALGPLGNFTLVLLFLTRAVYHIGTLLSLWTLPSLSLGYSSDLNVLVGLLFFSWDYIPAFLVLRTLGSVRSTIISRDRRKRRARKLHRRATRGSSAGGGLDAGLSNSEDFLEGASNKNASLMANTRSMLPNYGVFSMITESGAVLPSHSESGGAAVLASSGSVREDTTFPMFNSPHSVSSGSSEYHTVGSWTYSGSYTGYKRGYTPYK